MLLLKSKIQRLKSFLLKSVDISSLAFLRITFGITLCWEVLRYFYYNWITIYWIEPQFFFTFECFHWVRPFEGNGMYLHFFFLGILAIFIAIGFLYRMSIVLFFLGFSYIFLLDKSNYLNHFYFIILISFLFIFISPHKSLSIDALLKPSHRSDFVPRWMVLIIQIQVGIVYFFGGVAKINVDWLAGEPLRTWLSWKTDFPIIGPFLTEEWMVYFFVYSGLLLDLLVPFFLVYKKTRFFAFFSLVLFHLMNSELFQIGIFPWLMIAISTIFFEPDWFRKLLNLLKPYFWNRKKLNKNQPTNNWILSILSVFFVLQLLLPLRHHLYKGQVSWTEEGHRFSWHMKLRDKNSKARFIVKDLDSNESIRIKPLDYLTQRQARKMSNRPDMILQFAHYLGNIFRNEGFQNIEVYAEVETSLNNRPIQQLIKPDINLLTINSATPIHQWVVPLQ